MESDKISMEIDSSSAPMEVTGKLFHYNKGAAFFRFVKEKRPTISPNFNFLGQLIEYEKRLTDCGRLTKKDNKTAEKSSTSIIQTLNL